METNTFIVDRNSNTCSLSKQCLGVCERDEARIDEGEIDV